MCCVVTFLFYALKEELLDALITRRSEVQILFPQPIYLPKIKLHQFKYF